MLRVVAIKMNGAKPEWDAAQMRFSNDAEAGQFLNPPYRAGWSL